MARKNSESGEHPTQSQRFVEAARKLGSHKSEERLDAALKKVAKAVAVVESVKEPIQFRLAERAGRKR